MLTLALVIISLAFFAYYLKFRKRIACDIPGPKPYPLVGNVFTFITGGDTWYRHRKFLTSAFHFKILENSIEIIDKNGKILAQQLASKAADGKDFNVQEILEKCSLEIIGEVVMDVKLNTQTTNDNDEYLRAVKNATDLSVQRIFSLWFQFDILFKYFGQYNKYRESVDIITNLPKNVIASKRQQIKESKETASEVADSENTKKMSRAKLLNSMLLESNFTDEEIHNEVMSFMFAGNDTITSGLSFCLYHLANYQEIQEKVYREIIEMLPSDYCPTIQTLSNLRYTETVIKESLRLYSPGPLIGRTILEPVTLPSGYTVPANTQLGIFIYGMHRCAKYFPEPDKFIPERFDPENKRHPFSFIPFSAGPRNCIGQKLAMLEMKTLIATFLKNYKLLPSEKREPLELSSQVTLRSKGGVPIRITKRA